MESRQGAAYHYTPDSETQGPICREPFIRGGDLRTVLSEDWRHVTCVNCRSAWPLKNPQRWTTHTERWGLPRRMRRWREERQLGNKNWYDGAFAETAQWIHRFSYWESRCEGESQAMKNLQRAARAYGDRFADMYKAARRPVWPLRLPIQRALDMAKADLETCALDYHAAVEAATKEAKKKRMEERSYD